MPQVISKTLDEVLMEIADRISREGKLVGDKARLGEVDAYDLRMAAAHLKRLRERVRILEGGTQ